MSVNRDVLNRLANIENGLSVLDSHLHTLMKGQRIMGEALDKMTAAVERNSAATDDLSVKVTELSDESAVVIDYIKNHPAASEDPKFLELAASLEAKTNQVIEANEKAVSVKDALDKAVSGVSASGGPAT